MADAPIDMTALSARHTSTAAGQRTKRRHRAEARLKLYGISAIVLAGAALIVLLGTVILKVLSVTHEYYLTLDVDLALDDKEIKQVEDPNPLRIPNLRGIVGDGLFATFPEKPGRKERRLVRGMLSSDAGYELGGIVKDDPSLIGKPYTFSALLDDRVQQYFRGDFGTFQEAGTTGTITIEPGEDDVLSLTLATGAFGEARQLLRAARLSEARRVQRQAGNQNNAVEVTERKLADATSDEERESLTKDLQGYQAARDSALAKAESLIARANDPDATFDLGVSDPSLFVSVDGGWIKLTQLGASSAIGVAMDPPGRLGSFEPGAWSAKLIERPEAERKLADREALWLENYAAAGKIEKRLNTRVLTAPDSSNPELAGIWGAIVGSFWTMMVTFILAFPIGVMAAIYLEEFAPKNRITAFIEVNINNLAAVPSIVFGLLGLTVLLSGVSLFGVDLFDGVLKNFLENPRSTPIAGGVVLALMSLPTIIIAARAAIKAVPPSIRDAALGLGASKLQTSTHHVLPLAMPGILTGSIIAMAQALGETAPLILVGMHAFIPPVAESPGEPSSVLPSLIYRWNDLSERLYDGKTAVAIAVLLIFLILMNALAVMLRKRFERRW